MIRCAARLRAMLRTAVVLTATAAIVGAQSADSPSRDSRLIVLRDGRILTGDLTPRPGGYDVALPAGRVFVPSERVRLEAGSLNEAWRKLRASQGQRTPETHLALARWCISHRLWSGARRELLDAIHLDSNRDDARRLLGYVERQLAGESRGVDPAAAATESPVTVMASRTSIPGTPAARYSLGGLSADVARDFVRDVQPLLANKCGNASCHGPGVNDFELVVPRQGSTPAIAERNLAAVMRFVNPARPEQSPLLTTGTSQHGQMPVPALRGRSGAKQISVLRAWVNAVAEELHTSGTSVGDSVATDVAPAGESPGANLADVPQLSGGGLPQRTSGASTPLGRIRELPERDARVLEEVRYQGRQDPFDPADFNRRYHGGSTPQSK